MLKVELHTHTADDPVDLIPHSTHELIDRAAALGYQALALTLHNLQLDPRPFVSYAAERGVTLIPGIERTIEGRHVLLLNFSTRSMDVDSFEALARLKAREPGLVVAPHPFFPMGNCLRDMMDRHADLFDAVECNAMYTSTLNFNEKAERWARERGKPMVGNGDVHRLRQLGTTWSMVDAEPTADAICDAIKAGRVRVESRPLSWVSAATTMSRLFSSDLRTMIGHRQGAGDRGRGAEDTRHGAGVRG
ncbi:MAG TPA: PHP-associated domain-containing protein [Vicinamibacterales bacterium]|nr:PHP-associated domain-containing protein [Vicinamibacterales bacterium]